MKVFEVLNRDVGTVTEQQIIERMKRFDWRCEFSDNFVTIANGQRELELIENQIYALWKTNPERAVRVWNENCHQPPADLDTPPAFLFRLQLQEEAE